MQKNKSNKEKVFRKFFSFRRSLGFPPLYLMSTTLITLAFPIRCSATTQSPRAQ